MFQFDSSLAAAVISYFLTLTFSQFYSNRLDGPCPDFSGWKHIYIFNRLSVNRPDFRVDLLCP